MVTFIYNTADLSSPSVAATQNLSALTRVCYSVKVKPSYPYIILGRFWLQTKRKLPNKRKVFNFKDRHVLLHDWPYIKASKFHEPNCRISSLKTKAVLRMIVWSLTLSLTQLTAGRPRSPLRPLHGGARWYTWSWESKIQTQHNYVIISRKLARGKLFESYIERRLHRGKAQIRWRIVITPPSEDSPQAPSPASVEAPSTLTMTVMSMLFEQAEMSPCNLRLAPLKFNAMKTYVVNNSSQKFPWMIVYWHHVLSMDMALKFALASQTILIWNLNFIILLHIVFHWSRPSGPENGCTTLIFQCFIS
jgi:hypothetical protein